MDSKTTAESMDIKAKKMESKIQVTTLLVSSMTKYHKLKETWAITLAVTTLEALKGEPKKVRKEAFKETPKRALKGLKDTLMDTRSTSKDMLRKAFKVNPRQRLLNLHQLAPHHRHS